MEESSEFNLKENQKEANYLSNSKKLTEKEKRKNKNSFNKPPY